METRKITEVVVDRKDVSQFISGRHSFNLSEAYGAHLFVYGMFDRKHAGDERILYRKRIDRNGDYRFVIRSRRAPEVYPEVKRFRVSDDPGRFSAGQRFSFGIDASPSWCSDGKRIRCTNSREMNRWLEGKGMKFGFVAYDTRWHDNGIMRVYRKGPGCKLNNVTFTGKMEITDPELFEDAYFNGIGREKAFGFGLLELAGEQDWQS